MQRLVDSLKKDNFKARTLIREIVLSVPFRNYNPAAVVAEPVSAAPAKKRAPLLGER